MAGLPDAVATVTPKTPEPRPPLPLAMRNPLLATMEPSPPVKFQIITRDEHEIVVGRLKIPTVSGHAFILRRFDTGAISVSTMFKAAFPGADDEVEKRETTWIRSNFDYNGANGAGARRLAGVWIPLPVALYVAHQYELHDIIIPLAHATPDPKVALRKHTRSANGATSTPTSPATSPVSKPTSKGAAHVPANSPPTKRRRAESPAASLPTLSSTTSLPVARNTRSSASPGRTTRSSASPGRTTRRSTAAAAQQLNVPEPIDEDVEDIGVRGPNAEEDIAEQKQLVATLKAAQDAVNASSPVVSVAVKRSIDDEPQLTLTLAKPADVGDMQIQRQIATNRRVAMTPTRKAAAWGSLAFAIGLGAVAFFPNLL